MRALVCEALGDPTKPLGSGALALRADAPAPPLPSEDHVLVRVAAASLNFPDALQVQGRYQDRPPLPFVVGKEAAGVVEAAGARVRGVAVGDRVVAVGDGAFAEVFAVHQGACWRVPDGLDLERAASMPIAYGTADVALRARARLAAGQTLVVLGASGGVGTAAVQIGKLVGARVVAVTSGAAKADYLRSLGADATVDAAALPPGAASLRQALRAAAPRGADAVFDPVGGAPALEALRACAWGAQYLAIGFVAGIPKVPLNLLLLNNVTLHGVYWGSYMKRRPAMLRESLEELLAWAAAGRLTVPAPRAFVLERAPEAMAALLERRVTGKLVLLPAAGAGAGAAGGRSRM